MEQEKAADPFHDGEAEDIYDLYNACNDVVRDGLRDVLKLRIDGVSIDRPFNSPAIYH